MKNYVVQVKGDDGVVREIAQFGNKELAEKYAGNDARMTVVEKERSTNRNNLNL